MKKNLIVILALVVIAAVVFFVATNKKAEQVAEEAPTTVEGELAPASDVAPDAVLEVVPATEVAAPATK